MPPRRPEHVTVCGNDHSPWVQAVLLGLHERGISHTLLTVPPLRVFVRDGILMPAVKIDDGPWIFDSATILREFGFAPVVPEDQRALLRLFGSSALRRTDDGWRFWSNFSRARDGHPNVLRRHWNHFFRAFSILYFFSLIRTGRRRMRPSDPEAGRNAMLSLQGRLEDATPFFGGEAPDTVDLQLFGLVEMFSSIPVDELEILQRDAKLDRLRRWVADMRRRFDDYGHHYGPTDFEPALPAAPTASATEQLAFWLGGATMVLAFPITLPLVAFYAMRVRRTGRTNPPSDQS